MRLTLFSEYRRSNGFSLLEVMVAISILSLAVLAIFQLFSINLRSIKKTGDYSKAIIHARSIMDESYSLSKLSDSTESFDLEDGFKAVRTVTLKSYEDSIKLYEIVVAVSWPPSGSLEIKGIKTFYETDE